MVRLNLFGFLTSLLLCNGVAFGQPNEPLTVVTYPVANLVVPISPAQSTPTNESALIERIRKTVAPASWDIAGGAGQIQYTTLDYLLRVKQTAAVHAELKKFLEKLERGQVSLNLTFLSLSDRTCERFGIGGAHWSDSDGLKHILLDDARLSQFVEAVQRDQTTSIMQAPKLTVFDGQEASIDVFDSFAFPTGAVVESNDGTQKVVRTNELIFVGTKNRVLSTISEDRKNVSVQIEIATRCSMADRVGSGLRTQKPPQNCRRKSQSLRKSRSPSPSKSLSNEQSLSLPEKQSWM